MKGSIYPAVSCTPRRQRARLGAVDLAELPPAPRLPWNTLARLSAFYLSVQRHGEIKVSDTLGLLFFPKLALVYQLALRK